MEAGKTALVTFAVGLDVLLVLKAEVLNVLVDGGDSSFLAGVLRGVVGVHAGTVPVSGDGLGVERDGDSELFAHSLEEVTGNPQLVSGGNTFDRTNLVLPLSRHDLGVDTGEGDVGMETGLGMGLDNLAAKRGVGSNGAVVGALGSGESTLGPAEGPLVSGEHGVLLLEAVPGGLLFALLEDLLSVDTHVVRMGLAVGEPGVAHDKDVVSTTEGIGVNGAGPDEDLRVTSGSLAGRRSIVVPLGKIGRGGGDLVEHHGLAADRAVVVKPDVLGEDAASLGKALGGNTSCQ